MQLVTKLRPDEPNDTEYRVYTYTAEGTHKLGIPAHVGAWCISNGIRISSHWHAYDEWEGWVCTRNLLIDFITKEQYDELKRKENNKGAVTDLKTEILFD